MGHAGLPFSGAVDPRYGCLSSVPPALPPPPVSMLYTSPPPGLLLPESLYRRPVVGFSDDSEKSSPELNDSLGADRGRMTSPQMLGRRRQVDSSESMSEASARTRQLNYPSLLLHTQLEALRHSQQQQQQQQQVRGRNAASDKSHPSRCSTAAEPSSSNSESETSAFQQPRRRRATPDLITSNTGENSPDRISPVSLCGDDAKSPARKSGMDYFTQTFKHSGIFV